MKQNTQEQEKAFLVTVSDLNVPDTEDGFCKSFYTNRLFVCTDDMATFRMEEVSEFDGAAFFGAIKLQYEYNLREFCKQNGRDYDVMVKAIDEIAEEIGFEEVAE